jgi:hypothetical protein
MPKNAVLCALFALHWVVNFCLLALPARGQESAAEPSAFWRLQGDRMATDIRVRKAWIQNCGSLILPSCGR